MIRKDIKSIFNNEEYDFSAFYDYLQNADYGNWDNINSDETIRQYINEKVKEGIRVSHILEALENNPSKEDLYCIWLGNSMETPTPINNKKDLLEALEIDLK